MLYRELKEQIDDPSPIIKKKTNLNFFNHSEYDLTRLKSDPTGLKHLGRNCQAYFTKSGLMVFGFCPAGSTSMAQFALGTTSA